MARGDMLVKNTTYGSGAEILNRPNYESVSMTIDFTTTYDTDNETDEKVVKAGTPIDKDGNAVKSTPWENVVGILLVDVYESRPQGTILTDAYVNTTRAQDNSGVKYDKDLVLALNEAGCRIRFEDPFVLE